MTPMIDVVFLLLIFFVCTASFQAMELILPSNLLVSGGDSLDVPLEPPEDLEEIVVELTGGPGEVNYLVNERACSSLSEVGELLEAYATIDATLPVIIDCGDAVPLAEAIAVYDQIRRLGLTQVQFAADAE